MIINFIFIFGYFFFFFIFFFNGVFDGFYYIYIFLSFILCKHPSLLVSCDRQIPNKLYNHRIMEVYITIDSSCFGFVNPVRLKNNSSPVPSHHLVQSDSKIYRSSRHYSNCVRTTWTHRDKTDMRN